MSRQSSRQFCGDLVRAARERVSPRLTNEELARRVGVTLRTVQRWQDGESEPRGGQLLSLASALDVAPDDFYCDREAA